MKKQLIIFALLIIIATPFLVSCEKSMSEGFLNTENQNAMTDENFWKTEENFQSGMGSVYSVMAISAVFNGRGWELMNGRSDEYRARVPHNENLHAFFLCNPDMQYVYMRYSFFYKGIFRANHIIDMLEKTEEGSLSDEFKQLITAEAKTMRAIYHFYLMQDFGYIAYCDKGYMTMDEMQEYQVQLPQDEVFQKIVDDISSSYEFLPEKWDGNWTGRITKGAAMAYLGTVYLNWMKFDKAVEIFNQLVGNDPQGISVIGGYKLLNNVNDLWKQNADNNAESLFEAQFSTEGGANLWTWDENDASLANFTGKCATYQEEGWVSIIPYFCQQEQLASVWQYQEFFRDRYKRYTPVSTNKVSDVFDPRMVAGLAFEWEAAGQQGKTYGDVPFISGIGNKVPGAVTFWTNGFALRKLMSYWEDHEPEKSVKNYPLMRYADVLLMLAEAENEIGNISRAIACIDAVRQRAELPLIQDQPDCGSWNIDDVRDEIEHQRYIEFFGEGKRWYDMLRWERNPNRNYSILDTLVKHDYPHSKYNVGLHPENYDVGKDEYFPIPSKALDANKKIVDNYDHSKFESVNFKK